MSKFDLNHSLEILKAAFPYLDSRTKNTLELFIKFGDLFEMLNRSRQKDNVSASSFSGDDGTKREKTDVVGMLKNVRNVCYDDEIKIIDNVLNLVNAFELYETYQSLFSMMSSENDLGGLGNMFGMGDISTNPSDIMDILGTMLSPEDKDAMDNVSSILQMMNSSSDNNSESDEEETFEPDYIDDPSYISESEYEIQEKANGENSDVIFEYYDNDDYSNDFFKKYNNYYEDEEINDCDNKDEDRN